MKNKHNCQGCTERYVGCHGECASYIAFAKERNEILDKAHNNKDKDTKEYVMKAVERSNKKVNKVKKRKLSSII